MATPAPDRTVADRYMLKAPLGRGGMGVVWRAHDPVLGREVAVKEVVFPPSLPQAERRSAQARVMREARAAARLNHPGAVTLFDVIQDQGHPFIVMELVQAPTLADLVRAEGPLSPERVAEIGLQLASALEAAHLAGIVHRDVKPGNVMVPTDGGVKLADFGVASLQGDPQLTATGLVIGSPGYMAPEQASGEPSGPPADFWALGATMYFAVEGEPPFDKGASIPTLTAVVNEDPRPMRRAGPLAPVIGALLTKDPADRPSGPQLRAELGRLAGAAPKATEVLPAHRREPPASTTAPLPVVVPDPSPLAAGPGFGVQLPPPAEQPAGATPSGARPFPPVAPPSRPSGGRLLGALAVLVLAGVLVAWAVSALRSDGGGRAATATTTGGAATSRPAETTRQATSTGASATTQAPATTGAAGQLPAGWTSFTNRSGNDVVGVPPGWRARTRGSSNAVVVEEPDGARRVFTVRSTNPANPLPQASRDYRDYAERTFQDYREVRFDEDATYAGHSGAVVFEYEAVRDGRRVHVSHINFKGRTWGYNVELVTPAGQWASSQELARQFEQAFRPLG
ncbi:MAG TPA: protein kinase [Actinomycetota bacterium]|nr:protein kinase [Actinomycetota bacterium]